jgi:hypothetical protein
VNYWKVILATIVIFGAGVITGGLLVSHVDRPARPLFSFHQPPRPAPAVHTPYENMPPEVRPEILKTNFVQLLNDNLDLTPKQKEQIRKIIAQAQQNTHDLWKLVAPQFQLVWHDTRQQIRDVLTPQQQKEFESLMKQQRSLRHPSSTNAPPVTPSLSTNGPVI